jgi:hypothetical protein
MSIIDILTVAEAWTDEGELNLPVAHGEELHLLAPTHRRVRVPLFLVTPSLTSKSSRTKRPDDRRN